MKMFETISARLPTCNRAVPEPTIELAIERAREGREGQRIGPLFRVGDAAAVLEGSRPLILDPLSGYPAARRHITGLNVHKSYEIAQSVTFPSRAWIG